MKIKLGMTDNVDAKIERPGGVNDSIRLKSLWQWEHWRDDKLIDKWEEGNICTDQGLNYMLDAAFSAGTSFATWYVALFNDNYTPAAGATYATPGYTESANYDEASRPQWQEAGPSAKIITNSANKASFTMSTGETIYGAALVSYATKSNTAHAGAKLFNVSQFTTGSKAVENDDVLKVTITLTIADS